jgi:hypothetical protein
MVYNDYMNTGNQKKYKRAVVRDKSGNFVFGFSAQRQCVQITATRSAAKVFSSMAAAQKFVDIYSDAGYGLKYADTEIIQVA